jgi:hypothetical protein
MRNALLLLLLIPCSAFAGLVSFGSNFPDPKLKGSTYDVQARDHADALRLRSAIYQKDMEITAFVRSCPPDSKNWRAEIQRFNDLRAQNYEMMKELRVIVARGY